MKELAQKLQHGHDQTKFMKFWNDLIWGSDVYKEYLRKQENLAVVFFNNNLNKQFDTNANAEKILHSGDEANFGTYYGLNYRKNNLYNEAIIA